MTTSATARGGAGAGTVRLPSVLHGLRGARASQLPTEIVAGVTLTALILPLNIGFAQVAGLPPIVGLYAAIVPSIVFGLLAHSRHLISSPDATIAAMFAGMLGAIASPSDPEYLQLVLGTTLLCGVIFAAFWAFRLGFLANFLSHAVLVGFVAGLGLEVLVGQIPKIMGVSVDAEGFFRQLWAIVLAIPSTNPPSLAIGLGTIVVIRMLARRSPRVPGALVALALATIVVALLGLDQRGVDVLGQVPAGLPELTIPRVPLADWPALVPIALAICVGTMAESPLLTRRYAERYHEPLDVDQDFFAFGAANVAAAFTGGMAIGSSTSRTAAVESAGGRSQVPSLVAGATVALIVVFFTDLLAMLPEAALAGMVANAVVGLIDVAALRQLWRVRRSECMVAIAAFVGVLVFGVLYGVLLAFGLSVLEMLWRVSRPHAAVLVVQADGRTFDAPRDGPVTRTEPGLVVYRFEASLFFANVTWLRADIDRLVRGDDPPPRWFILDASSMGDVDTTGADALAQVVAELRQAGITFAVSRMQHHVRDRLEAYGLLDAIGSERFYETNRAAVDAFAADAPDASGATQPVPV